MSENTNRPLATPPRRILIIEDEVGLAASMAAYLTRLGYQVETANEFEEGQALIAHYHYDLLIVDLHLSRIGGAEGLQIVSEVNRNDPTTRVIMLTAMSSPEVERESYARGVNVFLQKPKSMLEVARAAKTLLEGS